MCNLFLNELVRWVVYFVIYKPEDTCGCETRKQLLKFTNRNSSKQIKEFPSQLGTKHNWCSSCWHKRNGSCLWLSITHASKFCVWVMNSEVHHIIMNIMCMWTLINAMATQLYWAGTTGISDVVMNLLIKSWANYGFHHGYAIVGNWTESEQWFSYWRACTDVQLWLSSIHMQS